MDGGERTTARLKDAYDLVAESYADLIPDTSFEAPIDLAMIDEFTRSVGGRRRVLDAGCGAGRMIGPLSRAGLAADGTDLSPAMVEIARRRHASTAFAAAPLTAQPFSDAAFDGVLAWYSIIHTAPVDLEPVAREFARLLSTDGMLLVGFQAGVGERTIRRAYGHDLTLTAFLHEPEDVARLLRRNGFDIAATLRRAPRESERHAQGFVLARRAR